MSPTATVPATESIDPVNTSDTVFLAPRVHEHVRHQEVEELHRVTHRERHIHHIVKHLVPVIADSDPDVLEEAKVEHMLPLVRGGEAVGESRTDVEQGLHSSQYHTQPAVHATGSKISVQTVVLPVLDSRLAHDEPPHDQSSSHLNNGMHSGYTQTDVTSTQSAPTAISDELGGRQ